MIENAKMNYKEEVCMPKQEPEFQRLVFALRDQIAVAKELSISLNYVGNNLKPMGTPNKNAQDPRPSMPGLIGILWDEIDNLKAINQVNIETGDHFRSLLGS